MKYTWVLKLTACILLLLTGVSCKKKEHTLVDCTPVKEHVSVDLLSFDADLSSPYLGDDLAYFYFNQSINHYPAKSCGEDTGSIKLSIRNFTNRGLSLDYSFIAYNRDETLVVWKYSNSINLPPNGKMDIGEISKSTYPVSSGNTRLHFGMENMKYH